MRIFFGIIILIGVLACVSLVVAAPGMELDKITLDQQWTEGEIA